VPADAHLIVLHEACALPQGVPAGVTVDWLDCVGLDRTVEAVGLAVVDDPGTFLDAARQDPRVRVFRPLTAKLRAATESSAPPP
jgi:hypothetical protein